MTKSLTSYNASTGQMTIDVSAADPNLLGEMMRLHAFGQEGFRSFPVDERFVAIDQKDLPQNLVQEMLGDPAMREENDVVTAYNLDGITVAMFYDGDMTLAFIIDTPVAKRVVIIHDAKKDYGWEDL